MTARPVTPIWAASAILGNSFGVLRPSLSERGAASGLSVSVGRYAMAPPGRRDAGWRNAHAAVARHQCRSGGRLRGARTASASVDDLAELDRHDPDEVRTPWKNSQARPGHGVLLGHWQALPLLDAVHTLKRSGSPRSTRPASRPSRCRATCWPPPRPRRTTSSPGRQRGHRRSPPRAARRRRRRSAHSTSRPMPRPGPTRPRSAQRRAGVAGPRARRDCAASTIPASTPIGSPSSACSPRGRSRGPLRCR